MVCFTGMGKFKIAKGGWEAQMNDKFFFLLQNKKYLQLCVHSINFLITNEKERGV